MFTAFLIKYAEIGIKGRNRYIFEDALVQQIKYAVKRCDGEFKVYRTQGRIYVEALSEFDFDEVVDNLKTVFGISGICPVVYVEDEALKSWEKKLLSTSGKYTRSKIKRSKYMPEERGKITH